MTSSLSANAKFQRNHVGVAQFFLRQVSFKRVGFEIPKISPREIQELPRETPSAAAEGVLHEFPEPVRVAHNDKRVLSVPLCLVEGPVAEPLDGILVHLLPAQTQLVAPVALGFEQRAQQVG